MANKVRTGIGRGGRIILSVIVVIGVGCSVWPALENFISSIFVVLIVLAAMLALGWTLRTLFDGHLL